MTGRFYVNEIWEQNKYLPDAQLILLIVIKKYEVEDFKDSSDWNILNKLIFSEKSWRESKLTFADWD